jgi:aminopeptidase N
MVSDPLARAVVWGSLREGLRDSTLDPEQYLSVVEASVDHESDLGVEAVLGVCKASVGRYFTDPARARRLAVVAARLLDTAAPGSNRQLVAARAFLSFTSDADTLRAWLDGGAPAGLVPDEDLRWRVTRALCGIGALDVEDIEAERERDPSSQGALHALECRASLPDPTTKADAWRSITADGELSNYELYALGAYFFRPGQSELGEPYVSRYFEDIPATTGFRSGWMVEQLAALVYPAYALSDRTLQLAARCVDDERVPARLRRAIADETDDLRRALVSHNVYRR